MSALRRLGVVLALVIALAALGWYGWRAWDGSRAVQSTEDAYVRGDITALSPRVSGYAVEITADDNEAVTARQVLVRLDPRDYQAAVDRAEAQVRQAISQLARAEVQRQNQQLQITSAEAALGSAQAQAQRNGIDLSRARELRATGAGTQARLDDATAADQATRATALEAKANLDLQRQTLQQVDADALVARATLAAARASLASARIALEDTEVWAPIDGIVANRRTRVGEYVAVGTRMLSIVPLDGLWIEANFRETQMERMAPGQPVAFRLDRYPRLRLCGYVESVGPASGSEFALIPADNATGNFTKIVRRFPVRLRPNATEPNAGLLRPGMSAVVRVGVGEAEVAGCRFDAARDRRPPSLPRQPLRPGLDPAPGSGR